MEIKKIVIQKKLLCFSLLMICITAVYGANYYFSNLYIYDFMAITILLLSIIVFLLNGCKIIRSKYKSTLILTILMWIIGIFRASQYDLPISVILKESCYTVIPLMMYIAFKPLIKSKRDLSQLFHIIIVTGILCNIFAFIEMFFALQGIDVLNMHVFEKYRNGTPRFIIGETIIVLGFFISCSFLIDKHINIKNKFIYIIYIGLTLINLFWIIKTRTLSLYILATVLMILVLNKNIRIGIRLFIGVIVVCILIFIMLSNFIPEINKLINSDYGIQMRFSTITYYLDYFKQHWLFGAGFISSNPNYSTYSIVSGPFGRYYTSDVGIIGMMFKYGVLGLFWLFSWFYNGIRIIKDNSKDIPVYYTLLMKLIMLFLLFSCINLILTDNPRIPYIAMVMIIFESSYILKQHDSSIDINKQDYSDRKECEL